MKLRQLQLLAAFIMLAAAGSRASADLVITGILDGTLSGAVPRAFELYTTEAIADFEATYQFQYASNSNAYENSTTAFGAIPANSFFYITNSTSDLAAVFGSGLIAHQNGGIVPTGNDSGRVILKSDSSVVDEAYTNTTSDNVYTDSYMYRKDFTGPDSVYNASNWTFGGNDLLDSPNNTAAQIAALVPFGTYQAVAVPEASSFLFGGLSLAMAGLSYARRRRG